MTDTPKTLRCAIYTRVSTEHGLDQEFNSLHAQREAAEAYVKSQAHEGWRAIRDHYDDGGFSGGSTDRPALQKLLADVRARKVDVVVVYKVDRLTRSLSDFAKLVELFDAHAVSIVAVTQPFNTLTSMGRLTLNVLLSFAQFEREVTGERIRDKVAAAKRKGMRMGGPVPLGYRLENKKLVIDEEEAARVRTIFGRYLELGCLTALLRDLRARGILTKRTVRKDGSVRGGVPFGKGGLYFLLKNRVYVGEVVHKGKYYPGEHPALIEPELFEAVQNALTAQGQAQRRQRMSCAFLLTGKIFDDRGNRMSPSTAQKGGLRYRYYVSRPVVEGRKQEAGTVSRVSAPEIEAAVLAALKQRTRSSNEEADSPDGATDTELMEQALATAVVRSTTLELTINQTEEEPRAKPVVIPWSPQPIAPKREIILLAGSGTPETRPIHSESRARLVEAIAKARQWLNELVSGKVTSTGAIAASEACTDRSVRMALSLAFLSPELVRAAVQGRLPRRLGLRQLVDLREDWGRQAEIVSRCPVAS